MKYLDLNVIKKYEKYADYYNIARICRGLDKSTKTKEGFLVVYKRLKDHNKLKNIYATWDKYRTNYVNAKLAQMKKNKIALYDDKGIPTKMHIMWAYSPDI